MTGGERFVDRGGCPLCGCKRWQVHIDFEEIPIVRCGDCGFVFSARVLSAEALAAYYSEGFGGLRHQLGQSINAMVNAALLPRLLAFPPGTRFLDVGAGYGYLLGRLARRHGVLGTGVEPSHQEAAFARNELGVNVIPAMLADAGLAKASFDVVASFEVIEHVPQPREFIRELLDYVKPGGRLLVMTDNFDSRVVRRLGAGFPKWIPHTHISHFSSATLSRMLATMPGVVIEKSLTFTPWEFLAREALQRLRGDVPAPAQAYSLSRALASEMSGHYKYFQLRRLLNAAWARASAGASMNGAAMYFCCRKAA